MNSGKTLPPGTIGRLTAFAVGKDVKMDIVKRLKSSTGPITISKAVLQYEKNLINALKSAGFNYAGGDRLVQMAMSGFVGNIMLQRLGLSKLRNIESALNSASAGELFYLGVHIGHEGLKAVLDQDEDMKEESLQLVIMGKAETKIPKELKWEIQNTCHAMFGSNMLFLSGRIANLLGKEKAENLPNIDELPYGTLPILAEVKDFIDWEKRNRQNIN